MKRKRRPARGVDRKDKVIVTSVISSELRDARLAAKSPSAPHLIQAVSHLIKPGFLMQTLNWNARRLSLVDAV
eukprot:763008-Hanusia_phi.AAC.9